MKTSKLSQLHATNFARICIDVHVQVLRNRAVAKLAKLLSRWRAPVSQDGAEFCTRSIPIQIEESSKLAYKLFRSTGVSWIAKMLRVKF